MPLLYSYRAVQPAENRWNHQAKLDSLYCIWPKVLPSLPVPLDSLALDLLLEEKRSQLLSRQHIFKLKAVKF